MKRTSYPLLALGGLLVPGFAAAQMTCAALGSYLATQPNLAQYVPPPPAGWSPPSFPSPFCPVEFMS